MTAYVNTNADELLLSALNKQIKILISAAESASEYADLIENSYISLRNVLTDIENIGGDTDTTQLALLVESFNERFEAAEAAAREIQYDLGLAKKKYLNTKRELSGVPMTVAEIEKKLGISIRLVEEDPINLI